ncbi:hypothetical protein EOD42_19225 [Rhodovarius crocodyli]|uniref:Class I SAM-dependent methyltransferase n=1 Tax=Rhodovarius crocodyli TaxID=1979269 RepID=A0A437M3X2_9PROT|nr:hypothetical protein [Rhodovarius crocodyli]RVT92342.1 hypothetical protein EOD42_19225 [Rhodovarius crocodyli]
MHAASPLAGLRDRLDGLAGMLETPTGLIQGWSSLPDLLAGCGGDPAERRAAFRAHRLADLSMQDPLTEACWSHGPDVGQMMPFLFSDHPVLGRSAEQRLRQAGRTGQTIFSVSSHLPFAEGLRERCRFAARMVDALAEGRGDGRGDGRVLSLGAGLLPEAALARHAGDVARWTVYEKSVLSMDQLLGMHGLMRGLDVNLADPLRALLGGRQGGTFDLVLLGPLLDGLDDATARRAVDSAFALLRPGGSLFMGSFAEDLTDAAYLDVVLDWRPELRSQVEMERLAAGLPADDVAGMESFRGPSRTMNFLQVTRRG